MTLYCECGTKISSAIHGPRQKKTPRCAKCCRLEREARRSNQVCICGQEMEPWYVWNDGKPVWLCRHCDDEDED